ncbi:hypothetical protein CFM98_08360 [Klebsiella pneumoniae]|nr:hypothetical protein [Klebsiella pneumoniae]
MALLRQLTPRYADLMASQSGLLILHYLFYLFGTDPQSRAITAFFSPSGVNGFVSYKRQRLLRSN